MSWRLVVRVAASLTGTRRCRAAGESTGNKGSPGGHLRRGGGHMRRRSTANRQLVVDKSINTRLELGRPRGLRVTRCSASPELLCGRCPPAHACMRTGSRPNRGPRGHPRLTRTHSALGKRLDPMETVTRARRKGLRPGLPYMACEGCSVRELVTRNAGCLPASSKPPGGKLDGLRAAR